eukprot:178453-Chlamydomonas_euryale.AAC.1
MRTRVKRTCVWEVEAWTGSYFKVICQMNLPCAAGNPSPVQRGIPALCSGESRILPGVGSDHCFCFNAHGGNSDAHAGGRAAELDPNHPESIPAVWDSGPGTIKLDVLAVV